MQEKKGDCGQSGNWRALQGEQEKSDFLGSGYKPEPAREERQ